MKKVRARLITELVIAIIGAVALVVTAIIGYSASTYQTRHDDSKIEAGKTVELEFSKAKDVISQTFNLYPSSGELTIAAMQTSGKLKCKNTYNFKYKASKNQDYTFIIALSFKKNDMYTGQYTAGQVTGGVKYDALVSKTSGYKKASTLKVDWLVK